ncbi:MAG: hypothetical protein RJB66_2641 [Pseudomonadota bacterium]|jgi:HAE1 family hydrophobic/amphiphilic exporter-1
MNIVSTSIKRPIFITCIFFLILAVGALSLLKLPIDLFPDVTFPVVTVTTPYPGAGPKEVETLVSKVIEDELSSISGIKTLRSINKEGASVVIAEFSLKTDVKYAEQQIRDKMGSVKRKLPDDVDDYSVRRIDPADQPILSIGITGNLKPSELYDYASEVIKPQLQQIEQVGLVEILGGRKREIHVELDQDKLRAYGISAQQVAQRIGSAGQNIPAGKVANSEGELVYRTLAEFQNPQEIANTIVNFFANETPVRVKDLATINDTLEDERARAFFNGNRSLNLWIFKQSGSNTIAVVNALKKKVAEINEKNIEQQIPYRINIIRDNSKPIKANVDDVYESIFIGTILTILVVLFFLGNFRSTLITSIALPNSLLGAFILMALSGFTVNIMTLLALSLAVGLLIDDAIVVRENIFRHLEMGHSPFKAAYEGTKEVTLAVIATTFTVLAVFGPIAFLDGVVGQFFKQFGMTICFAMLISLFDALTMAPMLSAYFAGAHSETKQRHGLWGTILNRIESQYDRTFGVAIKSFDRFQTYLENTYEAILIHTLNHRKKVLLGGIGLFIASLLILKFVPKTFLPPQDNGEFQISFELKPGSTLDQTQEVGFKIASLIQSHKELDRLLMVIGNRDLENHKATFTLILKGSKERKLSTSQVKEVLREELKAFKEYKPIVSDMDAVGGGQRPFNVVFSGANLEELEAYTSKVYEKLKSHPALKDASSSVSKGKPEFQIVIDPIRAEQFGVSTKLAGAELRTLVEGVTPAVLRDNGIEYNVRVRSQPEQRDLRNRLNNITVPNINSKLVPINMIARTEERIGPATINRENRNRSVTIGADIAPSGPGMGGAIADIKSMTTKGELKLPLGISYSFSGQAQNFQELGTSMVVAVGLGVLFIYLVLSSLYESFILPFTIMLVLPLAVCGAFFALFITQKTLDMYSMIGCVMLLGVATKNSILLVDYTLQLKASGVPERDAIISAGRTRLRPILMTSFALIAGMLPVAIGLNEASKQRTSMGIAIIGGLISSTILTLVIIPAAYGYIESFNRWMKSFFRSQNQDLELIKIEKVENEVEQKSPLQHDL